MRRVAFVALAVLAIVAFACPNSRPTAIARDFSAFYCAGVAVRDGHDPYRASPIGSCEHAPKRPGFYRVPDGLTLPAPLPPCDLLGFAVLSRVPYEAATCLWFALLLAALGVTIETLHRITSLRRSLLLLVFAPIDGFDALFLGEIAPLAVASLALAMLALHRGRPRLAAVALLGSLCEPHVGIAPLLALVVCVPRSRLTIALGSASLALVSVVTVGIGIAIEYVRDVLPAHAISEIASTRQLSLTALVHALGFSDDTALTFGALSYLAMLAIGVAAAQQLAARDRFDPSIVAAPAALVLLGGVFIHAIQMPAALPAALVAYVRSTGRLKHAIGVALIVLAVPWLGFLPYGIVVPSIAFLVGMLVRKLLPVSPGVAVAAGFAAACYAYGLELGIAFGDPFPGSISLPASDPHDLAEVDWGRNVGALSALDTGVFELARLPAWLSIATIAVIVDAMSRSSDRVRAAMRARSSDLLRRARSLAERT